MEMAGGTPGKHDICSTTETVPRFLYQPLNKEPEKLFTKEELDSIIEKLEKYRKEYYDI